jgi:phosphatidylglycerol---prolipoprotein diacylglyceryl transferase
MHPILFRWRGFTIYSYPAMLYLGLVAGVAVGNVASHASGVDALRVYVATMILIFVALFGARLLFILTRWQTYRQDLRRILNRREGGLAQYGGLLLAVPLSVPLLVLLEVPFGAFWDIGIVTILVGMIPTRIGCLLNGCCAGRASTFPGSLYLPNREGIWCRRIPTQILEGLLAAALLIMSAVMWHRRPFPGAIFLLAVAGYATGRLALESARESTARGRGFTTHHAISVLMIVLALATLWLALPQVKG